MWFWCSSKAIAPLWSLWQVLQCKRAICAILLEVSKFSQTPRKIQASCWLPRSCGVKICRNCWKFFSSLGCCQWNKTFLRIQNIFFSRDFTFLILRRRKGAGVPNPRFPVSVFSVLCTLAKSRGWELETHRFLFSFLSVLILGHRSQDWCWEEIPPLFPVHVFPGWSPIVGKIATVQ